MHLPGQPWRHWAQASHRGQWEPSGWSMPMTFSLPIGSLHEYLCLNMGPWTPILETPPHHMEGGWLSRGEKDSSGGIFDACLHFVVYLVVIN